MKRNSPATPVGPSAVDLDGLLRRLHLPTIRRMYPEFEQRVEAVNNQSTADGPGETLFDMRPARLAPRSVN